MRNGTCVGMDVQRVYASTPIGIIQPFASDTNIPRGYLLADGASYPTADYPDLYAVIGNTYGGDTENFNVPDYRETVLVGVGENTTDTIASHDVYGLGEFKDDQLQRITGDFEVGNRNTQPHTSGAFSTKESPYTWFALSETATSSSSVEFDSSKVTCSGTTTHGKQKGVTYIIKAFHTNEGVDSKNEVSDPIIEYVDNAIAGIKDYSTEETLTGGKWIDGKPIYRICVSFPVCELKPNEWNIVNSLSIMGIDEIIDARAKRDADNSIIPLAARSRDTSIEVNSSTNFGIDKLILEYTKQ